MPSKRLWCKWACPFVPQGLSFAPHFERGAKLCRPFMGQHCTPGCRSSRACMWTQLRASKAVFLSIRQIDEKTGLNRSEILNLSQSVISSGINHAPNVFAFTEQGVAMLSSVLRSKRAILVNIEIMRAFVRLKRVVSLHKKLAHKLNLLERRVGKHEKEIQAIFEAIRKLVTPQPELEKRKRRIGFHPSILEE